MQGRKKARGERKRVCMRQMEREVTVQRERERESMKEKDRKEEGMCLISGPGECLV